MKKRRADLFCSVCVKRITKGGDCCSFCDAYYCVECVVQNEKNGDEPLIYECSQCETFFCFEELYARLDPPYRCPSCIKKAMVKNGLCRELAEFFATWYFDQVKVLLLYRLRTGILLPLDVIFMVVTKGWRMECMEGVHERDLSQKEYLKIKKKCCPLRATWRFFCAILIRE